jgi:hypothetical protein
MLLGHLLLADRNAVAQAIAGLHPAVAAIGLTPLLATLAILGVSDIHPDQSDQTECHADNQRSSQHFVPHCSILVCNTSLSREGNSLKRRLFVCQLALS